MWTSVTWLDNSVCACQCAHVCKAFPRVEPHSECSWPCRRSLMWGCRSDGDLLTPAADQSACTSVWACSGARGQDRPPT